MRLGPHTVTVIHAGPAADDPYGNATEGTATETDETGWSIQPLVGQEATQGRETIVSRWQGYGPANSVITATDRVRFNGNVYEVDGEVQRWDFPPLSHVVCLFRRSHS